MTHQQSVLHIGLADFAEPTLLLIGDENSLTWLAQQIDARRDLKLAEMPKIVRQTGISLHLIPAIHRGRLTRLEKAFNWEISSAEALRLALQLRELAISPVPAHTYLDSESNTADIQVVASRGEYDAAKIFAA